MDSPRHTEWESEREMRKRWKRNRGMIKRDMKERWVRKIERDE